MRAAYRKSQGRGGCHSGPRDDHPLSCDRPAAGGTSCDRCDERAGAVRTRIRDATRDRRRRGIAESLFQLGLVQQVLRRDLEEAGAPYVEEALAVVETVPDADVLLRSEIHRHVGFDLLLREERPDDARHHFQTSLDLRATLDERGWLASGHVALALCERVAGRREEALEHSRQALDVARAEGLRERFVPRPTTRCGKHRNCPISPRRSAFAPGRRLACDT